MPKQTTFLTILGFFLLAAPVEARDIAIIVNQDLNLETLSMDDVKKIYLGGMQFIEEKRPKPIDQNENEEIRKVFLQEVLQMSKSDYTKYWLHLVFQGGSNVPILKENSTAVIQTVRQLKEGIGYIWADEALEVQGIKIVLTIDRKKRKREVRLKTQAHRLPAPFLRTASFPEEIPKSASNLNEFSTISSSPTPPY